MAIQAQLCPENIGFCLGGSQDSMDNVCGFNELCFNLQQQQQQYMNHQQQLQILQQRNQNLCFENNGLLPKNNSINHQSIAFSQSIAAQMEKEKREIDWFICIQNERLRLALLVQRKQQLASLLKKYESKTQFLLRQKDEEIAKAMNRTIELEDFLRRMEIEKQTWQGLAKENEEMVMSLNNTIENLKETTFLLTKGVEDAESCCDMIENRGDETGENRGHEHYQENQEQRTRKMICKSCNSRNSCFIFLPCRHLSSCKACESFLDSCPVCKMVKKASIEEKLFNGHCPPRQQMTWWARTNHKAPSQPSCQKLAQNST